MRGLLLFVFLFFFSTSLFAQNWRTVNPHDTVYFKSEQSYWPASVVDYGGHYLRVAFIDSVRMSGSDSAFYFFKTTRYPTGQGCVDTAAPSWLGIRMVRQPDGVELYQNIYGDTITVKTNAMPGDSWVLARNAAGLVFQGTITVSGTDTINGVVDSVKTISIQAYQNNIPVAHSYNSKVLELSKNHGWVKTLDLYQFPNILSVPIYGAVFDSTQHSRLDKQYFDVPLDTAFWSWYATMPGNEWIHTTESHWPPDKTVTDSLIVSRQFLSPSVVAIKTKVVTYQLIYIGISGGYRDTSTLNMHYSFDTVVLANAVFHLMPTPVLPEAKNTGLRYMVGSLCNEKFRFIGQAVVLPGSSVWFAGGCMRLMQGTNGLYASNKMTMSPTGEFRFIDEVTAGPAGQGGIIYYENRYYNYIKIDTCAWGTKIDVAALGMQQVTMPTESIKVAPNPATNMVNITIPQTSVQLTVYDMMGRVVRNENLVAGVNTLSVGDLPTGLYVLRFSGSSINYTYKLLKN